jgi:DNA-binding transcriptional LysR family regulator
VAGFASGIASLIPRAAATLAREHPGLELGVVDTHPPEALELLRAGKVEVALVFRYDSADDELPGFQLQHLLDDSMYALAKRRVRGLSSLRDETWAAGCDRCRAHLVAQCHDAGFEPRIGFETDDMVLIQSLVATGLCVATLPGLALKAHQTEGVVATRLSALPRRVFTATYGELPHPPPVAALLAALTNAAKDSELSAI